MDDTPDDAERAAESDGNRAAESDTAAFSLERGYDRDDLAAVFREFATAFESGRPVRVRGDERTATVEVPQRVVAEFEAGHDTAVEPSVSELELELEWDDPEGSSVRLTDRDDEAVQGREGADAAEADPEMAVLPLEGLADRGSAAAIDVDGTADGPAETERDTDTESAGEEQPSDAGRTSRFEVYEDRGGQWRWRLVHWNGNIVADSGEGYASRSNAERAARSVMRTAPAASIQRLE
ncbi:amphi-Trp domain-containing protein [Natrinema longum]|uniref:DUF1508 domain-containing protein n=1 Tax=Natrinema longum TaxID=370324 RepID=A0A8A2U8F5_9EURY|nr:amphi-Trp domain-containing protein [Natrinema longum]MBZ6494449.1 DUF1508 domain-containing protein [Natrinema longum]QSW84228.1 DUF1508 domain-containing protein [Natrinema longum]